MKNLDDPSPDKKKIVYTIIFNYDKDKNIQLDTNVKKIIVF